MAAGMGGSCEPPEPPLNLPLGIQPKHVMRLAVRVQSYCFLRIYQLLYKQFRIKFPCSIAEKKMKILNRSVLLALRDSFVSWI